LIFLGDGNQKEVQKIDFDHGAYCLWCLITSLVTDLSHGMSSAVPISFTSIAPGRLCLFGEHQDYLGLPVIALALPLQCRIQVICRPLPALASSEGEGEGVIVTLHIPAQNETRRYDLSNLPPRQGPESVNDDPDFALAAIHEALDDDWTFGNGDGGAVDCISTTDIPMKAGCSSSSAFCVAWTNVLAQLAEKKLSPMELATRAHRAEVLHFGAPGGTMDHITSAIGGKPLRIGPGMWDLQTLPDLGVEDLGVWVLAYSGEPKDTFGHLWRCKNERLALLDKLGGDWDKQVPEDFLTHSEKELLNCTRVNKMTEEKAFEEWTKGGGGLGTGARLGALMAAHHDALRDGLHLSTPRLEGMNMSAMTAGAWGFKVVGSGGGGCGVAWTSEANAASVATAMEAAGAPQTWIIRHPSKGAFISMTETS
jgi:galactokinase